MTRRGLLQESPMGVLPDPKKRKRYHNSFAPEDELRIENFFCFVNRNFADGHKKISITLPE